MAHFAKVNSGTVKQVIVAEPEFFDTFVDDSPGQWIQCSYNTRGGVHYDPETGEPDGGTALRYNYPSPGWLYDVEADAFYEPQPFPSWSLDETTYTWICPVDPPTETNGIGYIWDEDVYQADAGDPKTQGWVMDPIFEGYEPPSE
jgi:hypothetical protein